MKPEILECSDSCFGHFVIAIEHDTWLFGTNNYFSFSTRRTQIVLFVMDLNIKIGNCISARTNPKRFDGVHRGCSQLCRTVDLDKLKCDQPVTVVFKPTDGGPPLPMFTPA